MDIHTAGVVAVDVGKTGTWVGPLLVGLGAGALDYSAAGPSALRDRVAVAGYYAAAISFVHLLGLAAWEVQTIRDYNWRMIGAVASLVTHGALIVCVAGWPKALAKGIAAKIKFAGTDSDSAKINQTLLGWTVAAAVTAPLSGTGGWGTATSWVAQVTTGMWSSLVSALMTWLGG